MMPGKEVAPSSPLRPDTAEVPYIRVEMWILLMFCKCSLVVYPNGDIMAQGSSRILFIGPARFGGASLRIDHKRSECCRAIYARHMYAHVVFFLNLILHMFIDVQTYV